MKAMKVFLFPLIIMLINCCIVHSQQVISNTGASLQASSGSISFTLGEPVIATLSTTGGIITQGFHQTRLTVTAIEDNFYNTMSVKVYPNPACEVLNVKMNFDDLNQIRLVLFSTTGNLLSVVKADKEVMEIDFSGYLSGAYVLKVYRGSREIATYKIVKLK